MTYDASNRKQIRAAEKAAERLEQDKIEFIRAALSTVQGRTWFYHFLAFCAPHRVEPTFDPNKDYFALGMKNVGMKVLLDIQSHCPDLYILMEQQENARIAAITAATERSSSPDTGRDAPGRGEWSDSAPDLRDLIDGDLDTEGGSD